MMAGQKDVIIIQEVYLSVKEVAELKDCSERYIRRVVQSMENVKMDNRSYLIPLTNLDPKLQRKYYKLHNIVPELPADEPVAEPKRYDEFTAKQREQIAEWTEILRKWEDFRNKYKKQKTEYDNMFVSIMKQQYPNLNISIDILYRKKKALKNNDLSGLIDKRGTYNKGQTKMPKEVFDVFMFYYLDQSKKSIAQCIELTKMNLAVTGGEDLFIPSYATFRREIEKIPKSVMVRGREGEKAYRDKCGPYITRLYDQMYSNDYWIADNHTLDIFSKSDEGEERHRLSLTCFIDARSGMPAGWNVTDNPNSASTILALRHGIKRCGIPKAIYMDNGSEFLTYDIAGRGHRRRKSNADEYIPPDIFKRLGIEMRNALVRNARAKPIERTFLDFKNQISKCFKTYCAGNSQERPERLKKVLKEDRIPYDSEIRDMLNDLLAGYMSNQKYGGSVGADAGLTKSEVFKKRLPDTVRMATDGELDLMLLRSSRVQKINRNGVQLTVYGMKLSYGLEELAFKHGEEVYVRYDPADLSTVRVYLAPGDTYMCTVSMNRETRLLFADNQDNVKIAQQKVGMVSKQNKKALKDILDAVPAERRLDALDLKVRQSQNNKINDLIKGNVKSVEFVMSNEVQEQLDGTSSADNITSVVIDMEAMIANAKKRKRSVY